MFTGRTAELDTELAQYKAEADFDDHLVPIDNLLEPGAASDALQTLDEFMFERAGTILVSWYEDLLHDCLNGVGKRCLDAKLSLEKARKQQATRPADEARAYDITAITPPQLTSEVAVVPALRLKLKASTASVFDTIFVKARARESVSWADFAGAMADLGFSVTPIYDSVFTFHPPESMGATRSITLRGPHASEIEGDMLLIFSRRLHRTYDWTAETFEVG